MTKKYKYLSRFFFFLGILLVFLPLIIFGISGCMNGSIVIEEKIKFSITFISAIALTLFGIKSKYNCRSVTYLLLFGCYFVMKNIQVVIVVSGICCILDEFVCRPLHNYYKTKYVINREIDKRG